MTVSRLRRCAPALVVVAVAAGLSGCSSTMSDAATVQYPDGAGAKTMRVDLRDFENELGELTGNAAFRDILSSQQPPIEVTERNVASLVSTVWLGDLITQTAVDRAFEARGLKLTADDVNQAVRQLETPQQGDPPLLVPSRITPDIYKTLSKGYRTTLAERRARANVLLESYANPTPAEVQAYYDQNKENFACGEGTPAVSHVLVKTEAEAQEILASLASGESFGNIAKTKSTDTASAVSGGFLGCLQPGQFVAPFQAAAEKATPGKAVGPVKTQFGYHVILVGPPSFEQLSAQISQAIAQGAVVKQAITEAEVTVNPRFGAPGAAQADQQTGAVVYVLRQPAVPSVANNRDATTTTTFPLAG